jgi:phosphoribosyl 1,2-cyclic phosphodiesterase
MKITFLGTRANIDVRSRAHWRHSSLLVETTRGRVMIDCGADWIRRVDDIAPDAILLTHAHPDHASGLSAGAPCPVHATAETQRLLAHYPVRSWRTISAARSSSICGVRVRAFPVVHSLAAPAVAFRIGSRAKALLYCPDVVSIPDVETALNGVSLYIGDGSSTVRPLVRRRGDALFGHTTIRAQIGWCANAGVPEALFTHCGKEILRDPRAAAARVAAMAREKGVRARIAMDGLELAL